MHISFYLEVCEKQTKVLYKKNKLKSYTIDLNSCFNWKHKKVLFTNHKKTFLWQKKSKFFSES